jgi:hypothetical protein
MRLICSILLLSATLSLYGQGNVNFANVGVGLNSPFTYWDGSGGVARIGAGTWSVELLAGPDAASLALAGPVYMGSFANGYFNAGQRTVSNVTTTTAQALVRVWDNMGGTVTSYAQAVSMGNILYGQIGIFTITLSVPPATPATMVNMSPATLIPEPSTIVLGLIGAVGALLFRRRGGSSARTK